jgi:glycosyltransferase involved in cell wall biosynthesis
MSTSKPLITVVIVNYNSADFVDISLYSLSKLTKNPYQVIIRDNNSKAADYQKLLTISSKYQNVQVYRNDTNLTGSMAHGTALNFLVKKVNTKYFSILDADALWLIKDWDEILIKEIDQKTKVIGTQVTLDSIKPKDFPLMFCILFETATFNKLNIDFRPKDISSGQDTGHELREKYLKSGFRGKIIEMKNTRTYKSGPFHQLLCAEYYKDGNYNKIFASHFSRGSTLGKAKYVSQNKLSLNSLPFFGDILLKLRGTYEKQLWISICRKIITQQTNV